MDVFGPFPKTSGNRYLLVIIDYFTKWVEAFPMKNVRAKMVAEVFLGQVITRQEFLSKFIQIRERVLNQKCFMI